MVSCSQEFSLDAARLSIHSHEDRDRFRFNALLCYERRDLSRELLVDVDRVLLIRSDDMYLGRLAHPVCDEQLLNASSIEGDDVVRALRNDRTKPE